MTTAHQDPMEYIWERVPKTKDGFIHYLPGDIPYLYTNGFVDTLAFTFQEWSAAFQDCIQPDKSYLIPKEKFLSLRTFRYEGPVFPPFDAQKVREGEWDDENLQKLYDLSIKPSSSIQKDIFWNSINSLKKQGFVQNGNLLINKAVKTQLAYLVERFPSPRRRLEKEVARIRKEQQAQFKDVNQSRDSSSFEEGKAVSEVKAEKFKELQAKAPIAPTLTSPDVVLKHEAIDIKKLKKPMSKIVG
jgi:hypothetical protein